MTKRISSLYEVNADLYLKDEKSALRASIAMLQAVPYGPLSDEVTTSTIRYLQLAFTEDALTLHLARQPTLASPTSHGRLRNLNQTRRFQSLSTPSSSTRSTSQPSSNTSTSLAWQPASSPTSTQLLRPISVLTLFPSPTRAANTRCSEHSFPLSP